MQTLISELRIYTGQNEGGEGCKFHQWKIFIYAPMNSVIYYKTSSELDGQLLIMASQKYREIQ